MDVDSGRSRKSINHRMDEFSKGTARDFRPLRAFIEEYKPHKALLVCNESTRRLVDGVLVLPWREFLQLLWSGEIVE